MPPPTFSLVTPSFNQGPFIRRTIESVLGQAGPFRVEYLVVDGGSRDDTLEILAEYRGRLEWISEPDGGQVDAINKGLRLARGDILAWLNSDDVLLPGALGRVASAFQLHPRTEWLHGQCLIIDENDREIRRWISLYKHRLAKGHSWERLLVENYVSQPTAFWRKDALGAVGYLDPTLPHAFDYDFWLRWARRGPPVYLEAPLAAFRWYESSFSGREFEAQLRENLAVVTRYVEGRRSVLWRKKLAIAGTLMIYRMMALLRRARRATGLARIASGPQNPRRTGS